MRFLSILFLLLLPFLLFAQPTTTAGDRTMAPASAAQRSLVPPAAYPNYSEYVAIMEGFAERYPDQCALEVWGELPSGHQILTLRITNQVKQGRARPQVLCSAAMHGDETAGYWLLLKLADHLLANNPGNILEDLDIFINPLANPDGAFRRGDESLRGAMRGNAANIDLNRNYPDPDDGPHPDGRRYQPETEIFMQAAREHSFDLAINIHGGAEVFNYPWDTYRNRHADNDWWNRISRDFASRVQTASGNKGYFDDRRNGVTNGHDWYPVAGSRQDYMNYYHRCREATLEVSSRKHFPPQDLLQLWEWVSPGLLGFINEGRLGLHGFVKDRTTGLPIAAQLSIPGHDHSNSEVFADGQYGNFHRYLAEGEYQILFSAPGYVPQWHNVVIKAGHRTDLQVQLEQLEAKRK